MSIYNTNYNSKITSKKICIRPNSKFLIITGSKGFFQPQRSRSSLATRNSTDMSSLNSLTDSNKDVKSSYSSALKNNLHSQIRAKTNENQVKFQKAEKILLDKKESMEDILDATSYIRSDKGIKETWVLNNNNNTPVLDKSPASNSDTEVNFKEDNPVATDDSYTAISTHYEKVISKKIQLPAGDVSSRVDIDNTSIKNSDSINELDLYLNSVTKNTLSRDDNVSQTLDKIEGYLRDIYNGIIAESDISNIL